MNKSTSNPGADMTIAHHLGAVKSRSGESLKRPKKPGANLCLSHLGHSSNESCTIRHLLTIWRHHQPGANLRLGHLGALDNQTKIFWWHDKTILTGATLYILKARTWSKNTTQNQRPARLTHLGKNKGFPANQKGSGKNKGWIWKNLYTRQVENLKRRLGKNGYPGGLKTRKGGPGKS